MQIYDRKTDTDYWVHLTLLEIVSLISCDFSDNPLGDNSKCL